MTIVCVVVCVDAALVLVCAFPGKSWNQTFYQAGTATMGFSLMEIKYATDDDVWVVGGQMGELSTSTCTPKCTRTQCRENVMSCGCLTTRLCCCVSWVGGL